MRKLRKNRGFTFVELIVAVAVVGVLAALAAPRFFRTMTQLKAKGAARDAVSVLRLARSQAVSKKIRYGVLFELDNRRITYFRDDNSSGTYDTGDSLLTREVLSTDVTLSNSTLTNNTVVFTSTGQATGSGAVRVQTNDGTWRYAVDVLASTGRVRLTAL